MLNLENTFYLCARETEGLVRGGECLRGRERTRTPEWPGRFLRKVDCEKIESEAPTIKKKHVEIVSTTKELSLVFERKNSKR
ncbi:hypothetical protein CH354_15050 [Leptospira levettii]|nr:hypothetical protein CH354_15050 [Leptospira levettii]PJZ99340.1 hypothetical protein CH369_15435 [Leptospira levettii]